MTWMTDNQEAQDRAQDMAAAKEFPTMYYQKDYYIETMIGSIIATITIILIIYKYRLTIIQTMKQVWKGIVYSWKNPKGITQAQYYGMVMCLISIFSPFILVVFTSYHVANIISGTLLTCGMILWILEVMRVS